MNIKEETQETLERVYSALEPIYNECKANPDIFFEMVFSFAMEYALDHYRSIGKVVGIKNIAHEWAVMDFEKNKGLKFIEDHYEI